MLKIKKVGLGVASIASLLLAIAPASAAMPLRLDVVKATRAPSAFYTFCKSFPRECRRNGPVVNAVALTKGRMAELRSVNRSVNRALRKVSEGANDHWSLGVSGRGDCEDFALLKRKRLIERGWPSSVLLMSVVRNRQGDGHAVLMVRTKEGDYILDSETSAIKPWSATGYRFFMRQSQTNPKSWVALDWRKWANVSAKARKSSRAKTRVAARGSTAFETLRLRVSHLR